MVAPNILLTAGHGAFEGGVWSQNVTFFPSYPSRGSSDPAYRFSYSYIAAWTAWTQNGNRAYDYGMVWVDNAPGQILGWLGVLWNANTSGRSWDAVGYPATPNPPFSGDAMDEAIGTFASSTVSGVIGLNNDNMEHGSSGGPWITDFNGSPREYANGLQSFHINDGDFTEYGPFFTADVKVSTTGSPIPPTAISFDDSRLGRTGFWRVWQAARGPGFRVSLKPIPGWRAVWRRYPAGRIGHGCRPPRRG